jgi:hypothetical protein
LVQTTIDESNYPAYLFRCRGRQHKNGLITIFQTGCGDLVLFEDAFFFLGETYECKNYGDKAEYVSRVSLAGKRSGSSKVRRFCAGYWGRIPAKEACPFPLHL